MQQFNSYCSAVISLFSYCNQRVKSFTEEEELYPICFSLSAALNFANSNSAVTSLVFSCARSSSVSGSAGAPLLMPSTSFEKTRPKYPPSSSSSCSSSSSFFCWRLFLECEISSLSSASSRF
jgi:hypothetical protein